MPGTARKNLGYDEGPDSRGNEAIKHRKFTMISAAAIMVRVL